MSSGAIPDEISSPRPPPSPKKKRKREERNPQFRRKLHPVKLRILFNGLIAIHRIHNGELKTSDRGWATMSVLTQNCKMANASSHSTAVVLAENGIQGADLERRQSAKLGRKSLSSFDLVVWAPL